MGISFLPATEELLRISEEVLTNNSRHRKYRKYLFIFTCLEVVGTGIGRFVSPALRFFLYFAIAALIVAVMSKVVFIPSETLKGFYLCCGILAFILAGLALPSTYVVDGLTDEYVKAVVRHMRGYAIYEEAEIEALQRTLDEFHGRATARISLFQWLLGALWALATFLYAQYTGLLLKLFPVDEAPQQLLNASASLFLFALMSLLFLIVVFGYKRGVDRIFRLSHLALRTLQLQLKLKEKRIQHASSKIRSRRVK